MSDELRLALVGVVAVVTAGVALLLRRGTSVRRHRVRLEGLGPGIVFFGSASCASCAEMRERLGGVGIEIDASSPSFPRSVDRVPALALLDSEGSGWIAYGLIGRRRLVRWLADGP